MTRLTAVWLWLVSWLVPGPERGDWRREWRAELTVADGTMRQARGAIMDAWFLRTEGWTMDAMWRDVRTAMRGLAHRPLFTALAGVTLAVGIGANTAIYSVVDGVLIDPLPYPESERLVSYNHDAPGLGVRVPVVPHSQAMYLHYFENATSLEAFAVFSDSYVNLIADGEPRRLQANQVTASYFDVLGIQPFLGRSFASGDDRPGSEPVAVLGYSVWEQTFGADRGVLGELVELDGTLRRVIGVMPADAVFTDEDLWLPLVIDPADADAGSLGLVGIGRLVEGASIEGANAEMQELLVRFAEAHPDDFSEEIMEEAGLTADVKPLRDVLVEDVRQALWLLLGTVGFVLLIACANVANLFLVRGESRCKERAVRRALGASRLDLTRQYLTEAVLLSMGGGLLGLGLATVAVGSLLRFAPSELPQVLGVEIDGSVLVVTAVISVLSGVAFGLFPVLGSRRDDLSRSLRDGGRASTVGRDRHRVRHGLVVAQVALALVLLVGSGLMARTFVAMSRVDLGFEPAGVLTYSVSLPAAEYPDPDRRLAFHRRLVERIHEMPGVVGVGTINGAPLTGQLTSASPMEPTDRPVSDGGLAPIVEQRRVSPGYFEALGIELVEGRELDWNDRADGLRGAVISATLADAFWPGESAVGRQMRGQGAEHSWEVVGVAEDVRFESVRDDPGPLIYLPIVAGTPEEPTGSTVMDVVVRVSGDPTDAIAANRDALRAVDPRLPLVRPRSYEAAVGDAMAATSFAVVLLGIAAAVALLLGTVGLYGVVSYVVSRRTQEIGIRIALGAPAGAVLRSVVGQGLRLTALGVAIGLAGAFALSRALASVLYGVSPADPMTFAATALALLGVAALATWIPARRASRVDPIEALKAE